MTWPRDLADDLPAPRDDEPASLRQDIADELADHLTTAFHCEQHRTADEAAAQARVLDRFGDPRKIARKLWFDALSEKIMSQRMTFVALLAVVLASLGSTALTWYLIDQARVVNQAMLEQSRDATAALLSQSQDSNRALMEQGQKANDALLTKLEALSATGGKAEPPPSMEWNSVKLRLYTGPKPGKPAVGYRVSLMGHLLETAKEITVERESDESGMVDLGLLRPGKHNLSIRTPWGDDRGWRGMTVLPGQSVVEEIECPAEPANVNFDCVVEWPEELREKGYCVVAHFDPLPHEVGGVRWSSYSLSRKRIVVIDQAGKLIPFPMPSNGPHIPPTQSPVGLWPFHGSSSFGASVSGAPLAGLYHMNPSELDLASRLNIALPESRGSVDPYQRFGFVVPDNASSMPLSCAGGTYRLSDLLVTDRRLDFKPSRPQSTRIGGTSVPDRDEPAADSDSEAVVPLWPVLGGLLERYAEKEMLLRMQQPVRQSKFNSLSDWVKTRDQVPGIWTETDKARSEVQPTFTASPDQPNHWTIAIPQRLVDIVLANPDVRAISDAQAEGEKPAKPE